MVDKKTERTYLTMNNKLSQKLLAIRFSTGVGRVAQVLLWMLIFAGFFIFLFALVDLSFALPKESRQNAALLFLIGFFICMCFNIWLFVRVSPNEAARIIDSSLNSKNPLVSDALALENQSSQSELHAFLKQRAIDEACNKISEVPTSAKTPLRAIGFAAIGLTVFCLSLLGIRSLHAETFDTVAKRLFIPSEDTPPFTNLRFALEKDSLETVYGGDIDVKVLISGEDILEDVNCIIKNPSTGATSELTSLKESRGVYVQKFTKLLANTEFAFRVGNARSEWFSIGVLTQPEIASTQIEVIPPSYTKKAPSTFDLEGGVLTLIKGSRVMLRVGSNRPLGTGKMDFKDLKTNEVVLQETTQKLLNDKTVEVEWIVKDSAKMEFTIFDITQTPGKSSLLFEQQAVEDMVPELAITKPAPRVLATPQMKLGFEGEVKDDFGLSQVSIYRSLEGFRDRGEVLVSNLDRQEFLYEEGVNLEEMGAQPGQLLEFYLEAKDFNPNMLGVASSDPIIVEIISMQEYAQMLRDKSVMNEFSARYSALAKQIQEARDSLKELDKTLDSGDEKKIDEARRKANETHEQSKSMLNKLAGDFQAFDLESRLQNIAKNGAVRMAENQSKLSDSKQALTKEDVEKMLKNLGEVGEQADGLQQEAMKLQKVGKVMQMAAEFKQIYYNQISIRDRMEKLSKEMAFGNIDNIAQLKSLGKLQANNKERLEKFAIDLKMHSDDLPEEFEELKLSVEDFLSRMEKLEIPKPMQASATAAEEGRSHDAFNDANLAVSLMKQLIEEPCKGGGFGDMIKGQCQPNKFKVQQDAESTMQQMLEALLNGVENPSSGKGGPGGGLGAGPGGVGKDGSVMEGYMRSSMPLYGPSRTEYGQAEFAHQGSGNSDEGGGARRKTKTIDSELQSSNSQDGSDSQLARDAVPLKYKEAVKKYFSKDTNN
jgi:hypothetical protein